MKTSEELVEEEISRKNKLKDLISESADALKNLGTGSGNTQINPGIGVGISPVNIYINGEKGLSVNRGKNNSNDSSNSDGKK